MKYALVTGASRGIGKAVAIRLASTGIPVIINYLKNAEAAQAVADEIAAAGGQAELLPFDLADAKAIEQAIDTFMAPSRRANNNGFCMRLQGMNFDRCQTKTDVYDLFRSRYYKVNAHAWQRHHTVEFRQHQGTTDFTKIENWVRFLAKLVDYSFKHTCPVCRTIEEIPFLTSTEKQFFISRRNALN